MAAFLRIFVVLSLISISLLNFAPPAVAAANDTPGGQLMLGRYVGYLKPDGNSDALALTMSSYLVLTEGEVSAHNALHFRLGLGGYLSSEYESETFENFQYDIDQGLLVLNDPHNEMVITAYIYSQPKSRLEARVYLRTSATWANLYLEYLPDLPAASFKAPFPLTPALAGQYEGTCANEKVVLQLETGKGLTLEVPVPTTGLNHYNITGTLGVVNGLCPRVNPVNRPSWCVDHSYTKGTYDFFQRTLTLTGTLETDVCTREGNDLNCDVRLLPKDHARGDLVETKCLLHKVNGTTNDFKVFQRQFHVAATPEQAQPLPHVLPPLNTALIAAAQGSFYGYLHNEYLDRYQPLRLDVTATSTSPNPHIQNKVFVSATSVLFFGNGSPSTFWAQQFDQRILSTWMQQNVAAIVPGYVLKSDSSDAYLEVTQWKSGYIAGNWFSSHFGKVGTFELVKGQSLPAIDPSAEMVPNIAGHFHGPGDHSAGSRDYWDLRVVVPKQPRTSEMSYLLFQGNYQLFAGGVPWPVRQLEQGSYDLYTGAVAWKTSDPGEGDPKLVSGSVDGTDTIQLFWPNDRSWAVGIFDRGLDTFRKVAR